MDSVKFKKRTIDNCPDCGERKRGVVFHPVTDIPGGFIIVQAQTKKFLCEDHFQSFVTINNLMVRYDD